jgi:hypothetical protein
MDISDLRFNRVKRKNGVNPPQYKRSEMKNYLLVFFWTPFPLGGGGVLDVHTIGCLLTDRALGIDVSHLISISEYRRYSSIVMTSRDSNWVSTGYQFESYFLCNLLLGVKAAKVCSLSEKKAAFIRVFNISEAWEEKRYILLALSCILY